MSDLWGPTHTESIIHWKYYISFTDDNTGITHKKKGQSFDQFQEYINGIEKEHGEVLKFMQFDNDKEFVKSCIRYRLLDESS